jgi:hypothetical protein
MNYLAFSFPVYSLSFKSNQVRNNVHVKIEFSVPLSLQPVEAEIASVKNVIQPRPQGLFCDFVSASV